MAHLVGERAISLSLRYEKDMWASGCFWLARKHCGNDGGYKWTFGSGTKLIVRPGKWGIRGRMERLRIKCLHISRNNCVIMDELEFLESLLLKF